MRGRLSILAMSLCLAGGVARAAEVLRVGKDMTSLAISHDGNRQWVPRDRVCVLQRAQEIACGQVVKATTKGAIVRLDNVNYDIIAGDKVISKFQPGALAVQKSSQKAQPPADAPLLNSVPSGSESYAYLFNISGGVTVGTSFFYPIVTAQFNVAPALAIGLTGNFFSYSDNGTGANLTSFGGNLTVNYYSEEYFRGLWLQAGGGMSYFAVSSGYPYETASTFTGLATVGWRGYWDLGLNIGVAAGFQYTQAPFFTYFTTVNSAGFQPLLMLDVGFSF